MVVVDVSRICVRDGGHASELTDRMKKWESRPRLALRAYSLRDGLAMDLFTEGWRRLRRRLGNIFVRKC